MENVQYWHKLLMQTALTSEILLFVCNFVLKIIAYYR